MSKRESSPLVDAAAGFEAELAVYARLGELFLKTPLTTLKHLERANHTLGEIADSERRMADAGKQLIEAISGARRRQEQLSSDVVGHAPTVQARNTLLGALMATMSELAGEVAKLNVLVTASSDEAPSPAAGDVSTAVLALSERAAQLAGTARDAEFEEVAAQAHALHQRLKAVGTKLQRASADG